jgi:F-type H+-transporting ATPase subunit a
MDHHTSWLSFLPGYGSLHDYVQSHYGDTTVIPVGGHTISTVHHIYAALIVLLILVATSLVARARFADVEKAIVPPRSFGIVAFYELFLETVLGVMASVIGPSYKRYVPVIGTLALFIFVSNMMGLIPGMLPATDNLNTTFACGLIVFLYFNFHGLRVHGIGHITHLANPVGTWWGWFLAPLLFPIELVGLCVRPVTLGIRLCANMVGDHAVLLAFAGIVPLLVPLPFYVLGFLVCVIQTAVFTILTCVYISLHASEEEGAHH